MSIPVVVDISGAQPTPPAMLLAELITSVSATNPGYTVNLPAIMVEDISSTDVGALVITDSARVELLNSLTPFGANNFMLSQLGQIYIGPGSAPAVPTNTSVSVVFQAVDPNTSAPLQGYVIPVGFTVGDGTYQYVVQDGGATDSNGFTLPLFCQATIPGTWAVATGTVTTIITSVPSTVALTCSNPATGVSGAVAQTAEEYRAQVMQAGQAVSTGTPAMLKTLLGNVPGVQQRLVSVRQQTNAWEIIVGGGDPYLVAYAIYDSGINIAGLVGSTLSVTNITQAAAGVVTTDHNHNYSNGQVAEINGLVTGMLPLNGTPFTVTVITEKTFSIGINTSGYIAYVSGGVVTPNLRNASPSISDYPDIYTVPFVDPPQQTVTIAAVWSTTASNFVSQAAVAQLAAPAIAAYVNSIPVGATMSVLILESTFLAAIASVLAANQVSQLTFAVSINGVSTAPEAGTKLIFGDPESYFETDPTGSGIAVTQS